MLFFQTFRSLFRVSMFDVLLYSVHLISCYCSVQAANVLKQIHLEQLYSKSKWKNGKKVAVKGHSAVSPIVDKLNYNNNNTNTGCISTFNSLLLPRYWKTSVLIIFRQHFQITFRHWSLTRSNRKNSIITFSRLN